MKVGYSYSNDEADEVRHSQGTFKVGLKNERGRVRQWGLVEVALSSSQQHKLRPSMEFNLRYRPTLAT
jgi:hypothetical protein